MTKILLPFSNTVWGVIMNPQSSNTYRHIINFSTPAIKEAFINNQLFKRRGVVYDYKQLLATTSPDQSFTRLSSSEAEFILDPEDYPEETYLSLLNKDFCIIEEDGEEQFYTLSGERNGNGNTIKFTAELDIFFTYPITEMFNDRPTRIQRAMLDRFILKDFASQSIYNKYASTNPAHRGRIDFNDPFFNSEPDLDPSISRTTLLPSADPILLTPTIPSELYNRSDLSPFPDIPFNIFDIALNTFTFNSLFTTLKEDGTIPWEKISTHISSNGRSDVKPLQLAGDQNSRTADPFSFHACVIDAVGKIWINDLDGKPIQYNLKYIYKNITYTVYPFPKDAIDGAATLKSSYSPLPYHPFTNLKGLTQDHIKFHIRAGGTEEREFIIEFQDKYDELPDHQKPFGLISIKATTNEELPFLTVMNNSWDNIPSVSSPFTVLEAIPSDDYKAEMYLGAPWKPSLETKLLLSPYRKFLVKGASAASLNLAPQLFSHSGLISWKQSHGFLPEAYSHFINFENYNNFNNLDVSNPFVPSTQDISVFTEIANYTFPSETVAWNEYISQNRAQLNTNMTSNITGAAIGLLGVAAAPFTGGASLALGLGAVTAAASSAKAIANQSAQISDIQNSPDKLNGGGGSTLILDLVSKSLKPTLTEYKLDPRLYFLTAQHFYKYGYNMANELLNINDFLHTRFIFNYIEAPETFENIKLQASSEIKQLINDTLASGVTIWHCIEPYNNPVKEYGAVNRELLLDIDPDTADEQEEALPLMPPEEKK